ncbi:MCE-family protein MCE4d [Mycolicibacterium aurum]|uniref:MCE-family protein MCE4d n=1 Tax=Mycolicibacterium aurum TaxID=1791 RepID=A0A448IFD9_MYCAU|nr:MCE family protein [Mycolicibacterium aurum]VEG51202.1 MCE-family protein MCE4d [Mycolicibacterium aurum]
MTADKSHWRNRIRNAALAALVLMLGASTYMVWPRPHPLRLEALFTSAVGLYPGDEVKVAGVPVGTITSIEPSVTHTSVKMTVGNNIHIPADAQALLVAPNLVSARFIELTPVYADGPAMTDGTVIDTDRTAVPVEWDDVKAELTQLSAQLGPQPGSLQGPLTSFVNQAADTFDGQGESFRQAVRELSQTAGRLGDSRTDLLGTVKNLHTLVDALSNSNEEIVAFSSHIASVSQVLADSSTDLSASLDTLNGALSDIRGFLRDNNEALIGQIDKLTNFTTLLNDHGEDIEQILHMAPHGLQNFYNIYNPAQGSVSGILTVPSFANPVQLVCGSVETGATPDYYKRAEICRQRMAPVLDRITANYPPILLRPITSITAYKGQVTYDTPETEAKSRTPVSQLQWLPAPGVTPPSVPADGDLTSLLLPAAPPPADGGPPSAPAQSSPPPVGFPPPPTELSPPPPGFLPSPTELSPPPPGFPPPPATQAPPVDTHGGG